MKLFEEGKIGKLTIKNRIVMAPMGTGLTDPDGRLSEREIDYYLARAKGGTGLIITGLFCVERNLEQSLSKTVNKLGTREPTLDSYMYVSRLSELADGIHDYGAKLAVQLTAGFGRVDSTSERPIAPSSVPCFWNSKLTAREITTEEVEQLVKSFELSAKLAKVAGADIIELHAHEGYLFDQFQTALWNKRSDKYGGDLRGRLTFALEVIEAIKRGAGADFPIIYRFGLKHYLEGGRDLEEGLDIARQMEAAGVDALEVDAGCYETWYWPHPTTYQPQGLMVDMAEAAKKVVRIPVAAIGKLNYPDLAERVLQEGKADFIVLGRALLADPEWPNKVQQGRAEDIRPCIGDYEGCFVRLLQSKYTSCTVNPVTGMEKNLALESTSRKRFVLVVGGGPAGMEAARVAALRGHKVALWEKTGSLGGNLIPASVPDFKKDYRDLVQYFFKQIDKLKIDVELGKEATIELIQGITPEVVVIATGAVPIVPQIAGLKKENAVTAIDILLRRKGAGKSVMVVGGGLVGCETALHLAHKGKKVTIVETLEYVARDIFLANRMYLLKMLAEANVDFLVNSNVVEMLDGSVKISDRYGVISFLEVDTLVFACGFEPCGGELVAALKDKIPEVYAIGDCVEPRKLINAIWEGFRIARLI